MQCDLVLGVFTGVQEIRVFFLNFSAASLMTLTISQSSVRHLEVYMAVLCESPVLVFVIRVQQDIVLQPGKKGFNRIAVYH